MMLTYQLLDNPLQLKEGSINVLVVENPVAMRNLISSIVHGRHELVLSKDFKIIEFAKNTEFIFDVFNLNCNSKTLLSKIASEAELIAKDNWEESMNLMSEVNDYGNLIVSQLNFPARFSYIEDAARLIKLLNIEFNDEELSFAESLLEYMSICRQLLKKELFIFFNLKSFLTKEELALLYKSVEYEQLRLILLESHNDENRYESEKVTIIDKDLCII